MATDIEESDTDDHERPAPPKRQCTRLVQAVETTWDMDKSSNEKEDMTQETENIEYDEVERLAREKLKRWQACQVAKGYVDNTINKVLENYIMGTSTSYSLEESRFQLFRGNDMEDTAVMMAIRNHGLVQSAEIVSQSSAFYSDKAPGYWTNNEYTNVHCSCPSNRIQGIGNFEDSVATTSTDSLRLSNSKSSEEYNRLDWDLDTIDENDQQENFLERAVAEAIKKKGLSALSVDYG
ncbi:hypothetical protein WH47_05750 [Habropoda laboriosa]|uniref:Uncharacterized protein n=1 Tax=Habropoda laboriosa TaxID=597456 RepID=A0A0L7QSH4_9HYME|nr:PREDICTED: uncharacterized protein LOC108575720 [Habropoda laboriosa]KOC61603.1 hypothetical protein WH47_05750 [Habropoda laboriosa]